MNIARNWLQLLKKPPSIPRSKTTARHAMAANYWSAKYFQAYKELVKANKGIRRLRKKIDKLQEQLNEKNNL